MLKVIRRGGPANAKQSQGVEEGNRLEKLETWGGRRVPTFALGGQQRALPRSHSSKILWLLQGLSVSGCHTHDGLAIRSELCSGPSFPGRKRKPLFDANSPRVLSVSQSQNFWGAPCAMNSAKRKYPCNAAAFFCPVETQ